jgi:hypothetical protein
MAGETGAVRPLPKILAASDFTPERQRLHHRIIANLLEGRRADAEGQREAVLTAGGPGSGKSVLARSINDGRGTPRGCAARPA